MKKFFSLLCAVAIVLSANAAPQLSKQLVKQKADRAYVETLRTNGAAPAKTIKKVACEKQLQLKNARTRQAAKVSFAKAVKPAAQVARAPKAKLEETDVTIGQIGFQNYGGGDFFYALLSEDNTLRFDFDILDESRASEEDIELGKTYSIDDLWIDYSYGRNLVTDEYFEYASASFTKSLLADGRVKIEAEVADESGNIYRLHYEEAEVLPGEFDIEIGQVDFSFFTEDNDVYYKLVSADNTCALTFDIVLAEGLTDVELGHTYVLEDMLAQYTRVSYDGVADNLVEASFTKTVDENSLVHIAGTAKDSHDRVFNFAYDETPFVPTGEEVEHSFAVSVKMSYSASYADWTISVDDGLYAMQLDILSDNADSPVGSYDSNNDDFDLGYTRVEVYDANGDSEMFKAHSATAVISESNDSIIIAAEIMGENGVLYKFDAFFAAPVKQGEVTIDASNLVLDDSWYDYFGIIWADASNDDYEVALTLKAASGDMVAGETFSGSIKNVATGLVAEIYSGSINVSNVDGGILLTGAVLCYDNIEYTLNLQYVLPEPQSQETIDATGVLYLMSQDGMNYWQASALNADSSRYVSILAIADSPAGSYAAGDLYASYTYIGKFVGADTTWYDMLDADITVAVNDDMASITGTILGQAENNADDVVEFTINLTLAIDDETGSQGGGNQYDAQDKEFKHVFPEYTLDDQYLAQYNVYVAEATDAENNYISIEFNVAAGVSELPAGVYPIDGSYAAGTVSNGEIDGSSIYGSFADVLSGGSITVPLWLMVDGTVTVLENGVIEVEATNTWGMVIECRLGQWSEGVENTDAAVKAVKAIRNGQLVIIRNGAEFNAQGAIMK